MDPRPPWLPDFCRMPRIAAVLGIAELVVVVIALAPTRAARWSLLEFGAASAFALWLALTVAITYCKAGPAIRRLPPTAGRAVTLLLPLPVAAFGAWAVQQIDLGLGWGLTLPVAETARFVVSVAALAILIAAIARRYFHVREQWQAQINAMAKAEVAALQARIRPHFLFNSMNTIASLVRHDPATAERAVEDLSELFRAALGAGQGESTLGEELHLVERFLAIEKLRLGERLRLDWRVADDVPRELRLPRLVLQPLAENAIVHGIARLPEGGTITITVERDAGALRVALRNPSLPPRERDAGNRHAQESVAQRLAYQFGATARLTGGFRDGYYECELRLPLP